ncbi:hypothetical protein M1L21_37720 [Streptomyces sp. AS02]|nr:hypothetical protein [Streptomyces sp. AS02]
MVAPARSVGDPQAAAVSAVALVSSAGLLAGLLGLAPLGAAWPVAPAVWPVELLVLLVAVWLVALELEAWVAPLGQALPRVVPRVPAAWLARAVA